MPLRPMPVGMLLVLLVLLRMTFSNAAVDLAAFGVVDHAHHADRIEPEWSVPVDAPATLGPWSATWLELWGDARDYERPRSLDRACLGRGRGGGGGRSFRCFPYGVSDPKEAREFLWRERVSEFRLRPLDAVFHVHGYRRRGGEGGPLLKRNADASVDWSADAARSWPDFVWVHIPLPRVPEFDVDAAFFRALRAAGRRTNRLPRLADALNRKDAFAALMRGSPFHPATFALPDEDAAARAALAEGRPLLLKPEFGGRGLGIVPVASAAALDAHFAADPARRREDYVLQEYIARPLLVNGFKFTLRVYALIASLHPLRVYMHSTGIVKFTSEPFDLGSFDDAAAADAHVISAHLELPAAVAGDVRTPSGDLPADELASREATVEDRGFRWSLQALWRYLRARGDVDPDVLQTRMREAVLTAVSRLPPAVVSDYEDLVGDSGCCFQLLGIDFDVDERGHPYLLEANVNPTLGAASFMPFDNLAKLPLLDDLFTMMRVSPFVQKAFMARNESAAAWEFAHRGGWELLSHSS